MPVSPYYEGPSSGLRKQTLVLTQKHGGLSHILGGPRNPSAMLTNLPLIQDKFASALTLLGVERAFGDLGSGLPGL